jgi:hypothetical protein
VSAMSVGIAECRSGLLLLFLSSVAGGCLWCGVWCCWCGFVIVVSFFNPLFFCHSCDPGLVAAPARTNSCNRPPSGRSPPPPHSLVSKTSETSGQPKWTGSSVMVGRSASPSLISGVPEPRAAGIHKAPPPLPVPPAPGAESAESYRLGPEHTIGGTNSRAHSRSPPPHPPKKQASSRLTGRTVPCPWAFACIPPGQEVILAQYGPLLQR